ncbi:MAG: HD-GYP domain-containing protein [Candidatus Krumholzibacteriia bacterium]
MAEPGPHGATHVRLPLARLSGTAVVAIPAVVLAGFLAVGSPAAGIAPSVIVGLTLHLLHRKLSFLSTLAGGSRRAADASAAQAELLHARIQELERRDSGHGDELRGAHEVAALALAKLVELHDPVTGSHLERLRAYTSLLSGELARLPRYRASLHPELVAVLPHASALHDVGKVGIPDRILQKAGRLTAQEFAVMKRHTTTGGHTLQELLRRAPGNRFLALGREIALYHHERWDGSGYPFGLRADQIPLSARIVALADVYDALTSERPYKAAYTHEATRAHIISQSGTHFDPDVVEAFLCCEGEFVRTRDALCARPAARHRQPPAAFPALEVVAST